MSTSCLLWDPSLLICSEIPISDRSQDSRDFQAENESWFVLDENIDNVLFHEYLSNSLTSIRPMMSFTLLMKSSLWKGMRMKKSRFVVPTDLSPYNLAKAATYPGGAVASGERGYG